MRIAVATALAALIASQASAASWSRRLDLQDCAVRAVSADETPSGDVVAIGSAYHVLESWSRTWLLRLAPDGTTRRAAWLLGEGVDQAALVRAFGDSLLIAGSAQPRAYLASAAVDDLQLRWQVLLEGPLPCPGQEACRRFVRVVDALPSGSGWIVLAEAVRGDDRACWLLELDAAGALVRQAVLDASDGGSSPVGLDRMGEALVVGAMGSDGRAWMSWMDPTPGSWKSTRAWSVALPAGGRLVDIAAAGSGTLIAAFEPGGEAPKDECHGDALAELAIPGPLERLVFGDATGRGVVLAGLRPDGSVPWARASCTTLDVSAKALATGTSGTLLACDAPGRDRDSILTSVDPAKGPGRSVRLARPRTHDDTQDLRARREGFLLVGQVAGSNAQPARLTSIPADLAPLRPCQGAEAPITWTATTLGTAPTAITVRPTSVSPKVAAATRSVFVPQVEDDCGLEELLPLPERR